MTNTTTDKLRAARAEHRELVQMIAASVARINALIEQGRRETLSQYDFEASRLEMAPLRLPSMGAISRDDDLILSKAFELQSHEPVNCPTQGDLVQTHLGCQVSLAVARAQIEEQTALEA